ncbi:MAG: hypothetical protein ACKOEC_13075 [Acidimicrobiia bacterium]
MSSSAARFVSVSLFALAFLPGTAETAAARQQAAPVAPEVVTRNGDGHAILRTTRIATPLVIDGRLDDPIYRDVKPASDFIQQEPIEGAPATDRTEVWVFYDDRNIYVAAKMLETDPSKRVTSDMRRDSNNLYNNDHIAVLFDTFTD